MQDVTKKTVLVVEDNDLNLKLFRDLLLIKGFNVLESQKAEGVIDIVKDSKPDLILMDIQLNGVCGTEIIKSIKKDDDLKHIPIIAITAFAMKHDEARIIQAGSDLYISKPVSLDSFYKAINKFITCPV